MQKIINNIVWFNTFTIIIVYRRKSKYNTIRERSSSVKISETQNSKQIQLEKFKMQVQCNNRNSFQIMKGTKS